MGLEDLSIRADAGKHGKMIILYSLGESCRFKFVFQESQIGIGFACFHIKLPERTVLMKIIEITKAASFRIKYLITLRFSVEGQNIQRCSVEMLHPSHAASIHSSGRDTGSFL